MPIIVKAKPGDSVGQVIKDFKKKVQQSKVLIKIKEKEFYKKPSEIRKEEKKERERKKR